MNGKGALGKLIALLMGIWLELPDEVNIGILISDALEKHITNSTYILETAKSGLRILGVAIILASLITIYNEARRGEWV